MATGASHGLGRKILLPLLAVAGLVFAVYSAVAGNQPPPVAPPVIEPAQAPFRSYVAGAGLIEASTQNVWVGTPVAGIVMEVWGKVGQRVKAGDPLFKLDDRDLRAELLVRQTALQTEQETLARLGRLPRTEDVPPAEARVKEAEAALADVRNQLAMAEGVTDRRAISQEDLSRRRFAVQTAEARLAEARAQVALLRAGAWKPDVDIARAKMAAAQAQVRAIETNIERLTVRAPIDGEILQVNIRRGEFAPVGVLSTPLVLLGNLDRLHVRVDVDENDAWRIRGQAPAVAFLRGNREMQAPLQFERIEPYIIPKRSLTGESTERVDTRVLQILYSFERGRLPAYVGQQMDVFIEATPLEASLPPALEHARP